MADGPAEWWAGLPPVCRVWGCLLFGSSLGQYLGLFNPGHVMLNFNLIFRKFEVWRLVGNFMWIGAFSMAYPFLLLLVAQYGVALEKQAFAGKTADFIFMLMFGMVVMDVVTLLVPFLQMPFCGIALCFMVVYLWSRHNPDKGVSVMGLITIKGFWVPWAFAFIELIFGRNIFVCLLGIITGHLYFFLTTLYPLKTGRQLLRTPQWLHNLVLKWETAGPQAPRQPPPGQPRAYGVAPAPPPQQQQSQVFRGRSYRLRDD